jgi:anaerobic carbon-monoxide dehydrogenase iron sulfur subunit
MKRIYCEIEKCLACKSCELACAAAHVQSDGLLKALREGEPPRPRIHVQAINAMRAIAIQCRCCEDPACAAACIAGGIRKDETAGGIVINLEKCVGCWSCIMVCPVGAITRNRGLHKVLKCDRCPDLDMPACVRACPTGALVSGDNGVMEKRQNANRRRRQ